MVKFILENRKRGELLKKLLKSEMYFNQICEGSGSRSTVANVLDDLLEKGMIEYEWKMIEKYAENPGRFGAVKMFRITKKCVDLVRRLNL